MIIYVKAYSIIHMPLSRVTHLETIITKLYRGDVKSQLLDYMGDIKVGPFGTKSRFKLGAYPSTGAQTDS